MNYIHAFGITGVLNEAPENDGGVFSSRSIMQQMRFICSYAMSFEPLMPKLSMTAVFYCVELPFITLEASEKSNTPSLLTSPGGKVCFMSDCTLTNYSVAPDKIPSLQDDRIAGR